MSQPRHTLPEMRILHTSDWHVGRTIRGRSRAAEHEAVLAEIAAVADAEQVELILVTGDQFDSAAPTPDAERIVYRVLLDLAGIAPLVVVAGNHDNPQRLEAVAPLLAANRVTVAAKLARPEDGGVVDVATDAGETARVALLPFLSQRAIVRADDLMALDADEHAGRYAERARQLLERLCAGFGDDTVNLVAGHLMVTGGQTAGSERTAHTIFDYYVPATAFPPAAHYVALGHLHRPQRVPAASPMWYAGSPLQLDFGEADDTKAVLVLDAAPGQPAEVRQVPLTAGRRLRTLRGTLDELREIAGTTGEDYLQIIVRGQGRAGMADDVRGWFPQAVDVSLERPDRRDDGTRSPQRLGRSEVELFGEYLAERDAADERVLALFSELWDEVHAPDPA